MTNRGHELSYECYDRILDRDVQIEIRYYDVGDYEVISDVADDVLARHLPDILDAINEDIHGRHEAAVERYWDSKLMARMGGD